MTQRKRARPTPRRIRARRVSAVGLLILIAGFVLTIGSQLLAATTSTASSMTSSRYAVTSLIAANHEHPRSFDEADGAVRDRTTVFDGGTPGVANLDPALLTALRRAATDAAEDGVEVFVDSGWRTPEYQERLLQQAIVKYGSKAEAARWVATPRTSAHVSGDAVDIGGSDATAWLSEHGAQYGLCQIYSNEPWHYELRSVSTGQDCPPMYADPTHDPRTK